jgi:hypothetical protein
MKKTTIYGLYSTRNNEIRYIGKSNNPKSRLKNHLWASKTKKENTHKACWIRKEINEGYDIKYKILEICSINEWVDKEIEYIRKYNNLTNHHKGGLGGSPIKYNKNYYELKKWVDDNLPKEINTITKWKLYIEKNYKNQIPLNPNKVYKTMGWVSWSDFLNTNNHSRIKYVSYEEFKKWVIKNDIKSPTEFKKSKKAIGIPSHPERIYSEWVGWVDVTPTSNVYKCGVYWSYNESKKFLNTNYPNITVSKFRELCKKNELPYQIPKKPERIYDNFNFKEFLRLNYIVVNYLDYESAKKIIQEFKIKNNREWRCFKKSDKLPNNIPKTPETFYKNDWISWGDWLGKG